MKSLRSKQSNYTSSSNNVSKPIVHLSVDNKQACDVHSND